MLLSSRLLLACLLVASPAQALSPAAPAWIVALCQSEEGQDKEDFLLEIAATASAWTRDTGLEACGVLGRQGSDRWSMVLSSNHSQIQCLFIDTLLLPGASLTSDQFHTHPDVGSSATLEVLPSTREHARYMKDDRLLGVTHIQLPDPHQMSAADKRVGGGYLAAGGRLVYQGATDNEARDLGEVPSSSSACVLRH